MSSNDDSQYFKHETIAIQLKGSAAIKESNFSNKMKCYEWFLEPQFYLVSGVYTAARLFLVVSQTYLSFYVCYYLRLPGEYVAVIPFVIIIVSLINSGATKYITTKVDLKVAFAISCIIGIGISVQFH